MLFANLYFLLGTFVVIFIAAPIGGLTGRLAGSVVAKSRRHPSSPFATFVDLVAGMIGLHIGIYAAFAGYSVSESWVNGQHSRTETGHAYAAIPLALVGAASAGILWRWFYPLIAQLANHPVVQRSWIARQCFSTSPRRWRDVHFFLRGTVLVNIAIIAPEILYASSSYWSPTLVVRIEWLWYSTPALLFGLVVAQWWSIKSRAIEQRKKVAVDWFLVILCIVVLVSTLARLLGFRSR